MEIKMKPIAKIYTEFDSKFAVPRQSGMQDGVGEIVFEKEFRDENALKGIEEFSHLWLLWYFSESDMQGKFKPTVRPPKLGGNVRVGVFATRSPFRPNPIGLSAVRLLRAEKRAGAGTVLIVEGADMVNGTPIFDIKPYLPFADCKTEASGGFTDGIDKQPLAVVLSDGVRNPFDEESYARLKSVLALDPRPGYKKQGDRVYGVAFGGYDVKFSVMDGKVWIVAFEKL